MVLVGFGWLCWFWLALVGGFWSVLIGFGWLVGFSILTRQLRKPSGLLGMDSKNKSTKVKIKQIETANH